MSAKNQTVAVAGGDGDTVNPRAFGAVGDGASHPLKSKDLASLPPTAPGGQVYAVGDEWDFVGLQEAIRAAFYSGAVPNATEAWRNRRLHIPAGQYVVNKPPTIEQLKSGVIFGDGRFATVILATGGNAALQFNGAWYSDISALRFQAASVHDGAVVELDGNFDGVHTQGVQSVTFRDCMFDGAMSAQYGLAITRRGEASGQGSENLLLNCSWQTSLAAGLLVRGFNSLQNTVVGGNFQSHPRHGVKVEAGSVNLYGVGFQSANGYTQVANDGWDIDCSTAGSRDRCVVDGCRSESLHIYRGAWSQYAVIRGCSNRNLPYGAWSANGNYAENAIIWGTTSGGDRHLYRCTVGGTTGANEPTWPTTGTVNDGSVEWADLTYNAVEIQAGSVTDCAFGPGAQVKGTINNGIFVERNSFERDDYRAPGSEGVYLNNFRLPFRALP